MPARIIRFLPFPTLALSMLVLPGCPVHTTCPNCEYRTATFSAADVSTWTAAKMDTYIDHDASTSAEKLPEISGDPDPCVTDKKDEPVLCRVKQVDGGKATVVLGVPSLADADHKITLHVSKGSVTETLTSTSVGAPSSKTAPGACPK